MDSRPSQQSQLRANAYSEPEPEIVALVDAPRPPLTVISPSGNGVLQVEIESHPPLSYLSEPILRLAGIARNGAYNRPLTPFGFQQERRTLWEAPETYYRVSPFSHAHLIKAPLLLIHGEIDGNAGTHPMQSERMYAAVAGNGGAARLVMLPFEGHAYRARESILHVIAEMLSWARRWTQQAP